MRENSSASAESALPCTAMVSLAFMPMMPVRIFFRPYFICGEVVVYDAQYFIALASDGPYFLDNIVRAAGAVFLVCERIMRAEGAFSRAAP